MLTGMKAIALLLSAMLASSIAPNSARAADTGKLATKVLHVNAGEVTADSGTYDYFIEKTAAGDERAALTAG